MMPRFFPIQKKIRRAFCCDPEPEYQEPDPGPEIPEAVPENFVRDPDPVPTHPGKIRNAITIFPDLSLQLPARIAHRIGAFELAIARFPQRRFA